MVEKLIDLVAGIAVRQDELDKLFDTTDVEFVFSPVRSQVNRYMGTVVEVHVFSGIRNLAEKFGAEIVHPTCWLTGKVEEYKLAFVQGHTLYFELGEKVEGGYKWR